MREIFKGIDFVDMGCDYGSTVDYRGMFNGR